MLSDIEIAQKNKMDKITDVAQKIGLTSDDLELYGDYKAKISFSKLKELQQSKNGGKVVLVTAGKVTSPTFSASLSSLFLLQAVKPKVAKTMIKLSKRVKSFFIIPIFFLISIHYRRHHN